mmetsp:Transcript_21162/g.39780  ORF Transcript_21162/g.39780 Transcript_21162/m.39780 type:complete len:137 (-) Transcript_21162:298-708(-)
MTAHVAKPVSDWGWAFPKDRHNKPITKVTPQRNRERLDSESSTASSRPATNGFQDRDALTPPAQLESLDMITTRTFSRMTGGSDSPSGTIRMQASMPFIRSKSSSSLGKAAEKTLIYKFSREKALNASISSTLRQR